MRLHWIGAIVVATLAVAQDVFNEITQLTFSGDHSHPVFSADKRYIYFTAKGGVYGRECDDVYRFDLKYYKWAPVDWKISRVSPGVGRSSNAAPTADPNTPLYYESTFEQTINEPSTEFGRTNSTCPPLSCSVQTPPAICSQKYYVEHFADTHIYGARADGSPISRTQTPKVGGSFQTSPSKTSSFLATSESCTVNTVSGVCLAIDGSAVLRPAANGQYYDSPSIGVNGKTQTMYFHGAALAKTAEETLFSTEGTAIYQSTVNPKGKPAKEKVFVAAAANTHNLYPKAVAKGANAIYTHIDAAGVRSLRRQYKIGNTPDTLTDLAFNTMQADVNSDESQIVFVRQPKPGDDYQVYLANMYAKPLVEDFPKKERTKLTKVTETFEMQSFIGFDGELGRVRWSELNNDLLFEWNPLASETNKCSQLYQVDTSIDDFSSPRLLSTGIGRVAGADFHDFEKDGQLQAHVIYSGDFLQRRDDDAELGDCPAVGCDPLNEKWNDAAELKEFCEEAKETVYLGESFELFEVNILGNIQRRLTTNDVYDGEPVVSRDGHWLAFVRAANSRVDIVVMNLTSREENVITHYLPAGYYAAPAFSLDGRHLVFHGSAAEDQFRFKRFLSTYKVVNVDSTELYLADLSGKVKKIDVGTVAKSPVFGTDGRIVFEAKVETTDGAGAKTQHWEIRRVDTDGKNVQLISEPEWSARSISFTRRGRSHSVFIGSEPPAPVPAPVAPAPPPPPPPPAPAPKRDAIFFARYRTSAPLTTSTTTQATTTSTIADEPEPLPPPKTTSSTTRRSPTKPTTPTTTRRPEPPPPTPPTEAPPKKPEHNGGAKRSGSWLWIVAVASICLFRRYS